MKTDEILEPPLYVFLLLKSTCPSCRVIGWSCDKGRYYLTVRVSLVTSVPQVGTLLAMGRRGTRSLQFYFEEGQGLTRHAFIMHNIIQNQALSETNKTGDTIRYCRSDKQCLLSQLFYIKTLFDKQNRVSKFKMSIFKTTVPEFNASWFLWS